MPVDIPTLLDECSRSVKPMTPPALAAYFHLPESHFHAFGAPSGPIQFVQAGLGGPLAHALRGTIFWPGNGQIVRGYPHILPASDYAGDPSAAVAAEMDFYQALAEAEAAIEVAEPGIRLRLYAHAGKLHFATDVRYDGSNPLIGTGIENARALGIDCVSQASRLMTSAYPEAARLARLGYVPVFDLVLPERESLVPVERPDLVLIDVIDPDHCFVDRLEKERIAEDYGLRPSTLHGRLTNCATPAEMYGRLRGLEHIAARDDVLGYVVKVPCRGDQAAIEVEAPAVRQAWVSVAQSDLRAAHEAVVEDYGTDDGSGKRTLAISSDTLEELILEYLGEPRRSVRWQVREFLAIGAS